jgi:PE family
MSSVIAAPELISTAATDLANIGSSLNAAHLSAAPTTLGVLPAAADEVSAGVAHLFSSHAQEYQAIAGQVAAFHQQFTQNLTAGAKSYASAEATNAAALQPLAAAAAPVAAAVAAANPVVAWFQAILRALRHAIERLIFFLLSPILDPIINAVANALATAVAQAIANAF